MNASARGLMLCDDLIFFSRVEGAARAQSLSVRMVRNSAELLLALRQEPPSGIILDLHNDSLDLPALLSHIRSACPVLPHIVAYGSHVEAETLRAARAAGCDLVMPRSQFVTHIETDLAKWLASHG